MTDHTFTAVRGWADGNAFRAFADTMTRMVRAVRREMEIARARRALEAMSDEMLRDMGIDRYQIDMAARCGRSERAGRPL